ncbi:MAG: 4-hydroxythreonine-4-phosphate dehydrogenase PdxA, partial [Bacteroidales bacterium]|nr:4-hydroxythreonine-4-phosphate dehydrogenase PdxA [Bacteroidales bacterium]
EPHILDICVPIIYGSAKIIGYYKKNLGMEQLPITYVHSASEAQPHRISLVNCGQEEVKVEMGQPSAESGQMAYLALRKATEEWQAGMIDGIVTAPINKASIQNKEFSFPGHTEYFGNVCNATPLMILASERLRVALVTNHLPIEKVAEAITPALILEKLRILNQSLKNDFGIILPRIAVLALNPHAGDNGLLGNEEQEIITPSIKAAVEEGICCVGPFSADGFFGAGTFTNYDAVLAMYHDQGLAPFKVYAMDEGINITAGLPLVRTAPDHGTAYSLVGKGVASHTSMLHAIYQAIDIVKQRAFQTEIHSNPLETIIKTDKDA